MSNDQKKTNKFKQFITNHPEVVVYGAATAVVGGLYTYAVVRANQAQKAAVKEINAYADKVNSLIATAEQDGKAVFQLSDWSYLLVPKETPTEWIKL
ncbi:hypothetical protein SEA_TEACUP_36 [Arthrobacter phage Teacup]|uniref:Uncharacterized protein n=1 Tax=Arthrobacter phage Teacup TaxID=2015871 RepID=A0A222ZIN6_9CAUD|nr:hypothetical protein QCN31_gp36 [Arthrobacter phage Teacup]ASR84041.1 hypothetical protein SEA_TEACUP_36 [Arthrobacter phage Teacup]